MFTYLDDDPALVEKTPFPAACEDPNRVYVLAEEDGDHGGKLLDSKTIGTQAEGEDLEWIGNIERNPDGARQVSFVLRRPSIGLHKLAWQLVIMAGEEDNENSIYQQRL